MKYALYAICVNAHTHTDCKECGLTSQQHNSPGSPEKSEESSYSEGKDNLHDIVLILFLTTGIYRGVINRLQGISCRKYTI